MSVTRHILFLLLLFFLPCKPLNAGHSHTQKQDMIADILSYVNNFRHQHGLKSLELNETISKEATRHSRDMANHSIPFGHSGFADRMHDLQHKIHGVDAMAENVAYGEITAKEVVDLWLHSKGHRRNILGNYDITGIGIVKAPDGAYYFTQIFLHQN